MIEADIPVTVDVEDDAIWEKIEEGTGLTVPVDANDIVMALDDDELVISFIREMVQAAGLEFDQIVLRRTAETSSEETP